jgi:23S rRNA pseudouridine1911/1915/1917 synthase
MEIIYEDNHLIVVNKPFGMPSQGDETGDDNVFEWVKRYIKEKYQKPGRVYAALLHRLDRPTGGLLALARTSKAAERVSRQFQQRKVEKVYYAITERIPEPREGDLRHFLRKLPGKNIMRAYQHEIQGAKEARLHYQLIRTHGEKALLEVHPYTGRRHQIRVQLARIGCTIQGDVKYGKTAFNPDKSICLFAKQLTFIHPTRRHPMTFEAPWPQNELWRPFEREG